jgi:hypothetical protein
LIWVGAEVFQAGRIAEKELLPFEHVTADGILAVYFHSANGIDDGSACGRLLIWPPDAAPVISLVVHLDYVRMYRVPAKKHT